MDGAEGYDPWGTARIARLPEGQEYDLQSMLDAQQRLVSSGYYDSVFLSLADSPLLEALSGRSLADPPASRWTVRQDGGEFDAIAGATVSSRAVIGGVRRAMQFFTTHRDEIFAPP